MNDSSNRTTPTRRRLPASAWLIALAMLLSACTPWTKAHSWPEETIRSAAQAFVDGYNQGDLTVFDSYFAAPDQVVDPAGLTRTLDVAHQWLAEAQPGSSLQLLSLTVTAQQPADPQVLASVHYRLRLRLRNGQEITDTRLIEQTVQLEHLGDKWLIIGGDEAQTTSVAPQASAPSAQATVPNDSASATGAAIEMLAGTLGIAPLEIKVVSSEALSWPDGCLGVTRPGVLCTRGETPGFRIILETGGQRYEYHTDSTGVMVLPGKEGPVIANSVAASAAQETLAAKLGIPADQVRVVSKTLVEWPDDCLGVAMSDKPCSAQVTPGYLITLEAQGQQIDYHTNADASVIVPGVAP